MNLQQRNNSLARSVWTRINYMYYLADQDADYLTKNDYHLAIHYPYLIGRSWKLIEET